MMERLKAIQVQAASAAVAEIRYGAERIAEDQRAAAASARAGLAIGSRVEWLALEKAFPAAGIRRAKLQAAEGQRRAAQALAVEAHLNSRMAARQVAAMLCGNLREEGKLSERREKGRLDERLLWQRWKQQAGAEKERE